MRAMSKHKTPIRTYIRDGLTVSVRSEIDGQNNVITWALKWDDTKNGRRNCSISYTRWEAIKALAAKYGHRNPEVVESTCAGFASFFA